MEHDRHEFDLPGWRASAPLAKDSEEAMNLGSDLDLQLLLGGGYRRRMSLDLGRLSLTRFVLIRTLCTLHWTWRGD